MERHAVLNARHGDRLAEAIELQLLLSVFKAWKENQQGIYGGSVVTHHCHGRRPVLCQVFGLDDTVLVVAWGTAYIAWSAMGPPTL
jgi:hypothetical protein